MTKETYVFPLRELKRLRGWYTRFGKPVPVEIDTLVCMTCLQGVQWCDCEVAVGDVCRVQ